MAKASGNSRKGGRRGGGQRGSGSKLFLGGFVGLVIGVLIAFGVVLYLNKSDLPFVEKNSRSEPVASGGDGKEAQPLPGKPGDKPYEKPRFEFYGILPGKQEPTPDTPAADAAKPAGSEFAAQPTEQFYLQVGAFQKAAEVDNLKAQLALMGVEASVQDVTLPEKGTLHRVRTGPYSTPAAMNQARTLMAQNGVQATVIKVKVQEPGN